MDSTTHKKKRKRENDEISSSKQNKHTHDDKPSIKTPRPNEPLRPTNEPLPEEHIQLLDSVKGHIKELTQVNDSYQDLDEPMGKDVSKLEDRKKKSKQTESPTEEKSIEEVKECAIEYLRLWDENKKKWSFRKKPQYWLLQNMYQKSMVSKAHFKVLLRYLEGLQGHQRQLVTERARIILDQYSEEMPEGSPTKREYKRAVGILRVLA